MSAVPLYSFNEVRQDPPLQLTRGICHEPYVRQSRASHVCASERRR